jgi:type II secretory pathway pseudopilin PulG
MLVATTIMGIAVVGLLSSLTTSMRNAGRVTDADRAAVLARSKMEELLSDPTLPFEAQWNGDFDQSSGWIAQTGPFEVPPNAVPGSLMLQKVSLVVWWQNGASRHEFPLESYRMIEAPRQAAQ